jgi:hypothetical protein
MNPEASIREFRYPEDYPSAAGLWQAIEKGHPVGQV